MYKLWVVITQTKYSISKLSTVVVLQIASDYHLHSPNNLLNWNGENKLIFANVMLQCWFNQVLNIINEGWIQTNDIPVAVAKCCRYHCIPCNQDIFNTLPSLANHHLSGWSLRWSFLTHFYKKNIDIYISVSCILYSFRRPWLWYKHIVWLNDFAIYWKVGKIYMWIEIKNYKIFNFQSSFSPLKPCLPKRNLKTK